jgi:ubiquitin-protein ligase
MPRLTEFAEGHVFPEHPQRSLENQSSISILDQYINLYLECYYEHHLFSLKTSIYPAFPLDPPIYVTENREAASRRCWEFSLWEEVALGQCQ